MRRWVWIAALVCGTVWLGGCGDETPTTPSEVRIGPVVTFADHREISIDFASNGAVLTGTLYLPLTGSGFATVAENPGSSWEERSTWADVGPFVETLEVGVFSYDKRGFGASGGSPVSVEPNAAFDALADDLVAAARALRDVGLVRNDRIGVLGSSQGGWVVPLAANRDRTTIGFALSFVGGAVSTGQEGLFDDLSGYSVCERSELSMEEINQRMREAGPSGFDPRPSLLAMQQPALWLYGGLDFSHPAEFSAELLAEVDGVAAKPWTVVIVPDANHEGIAGGTICQSEGPRADYITPLAAWMNDLFGT